MLFRSPVVSPLDPKWLVIAGFCLYAWFAIWSINKPLTTDESEFGAVAVAIGKTGKPIYYMGDSPDRYWPAKDMWQKLEAPRPGFQYGTWHSSLYISWLALWVKLLGMANWVVRLAGVACFLGTLWLVRKILYLALPSERAGRVFGPVAFLYLVNPLLIQQGMMLDIDTTVVTFTSVLFLHEVLRLEIRQVAWWRQSVWLGVILALGFWAKEFAGLYLALTAFVYVLLRRNWRGAAGGVTALIIGVGLFWGTWWLYCKAFDLPVMYFIRFTILGKLAIGEGLFRTIAAQSGLTNAIFSVLFSLFNITVWTSPFYWALLIGVIVWRGREFWLSKKPAPLDLLLLFGLLMMAVTQVYRPSGWFLKYGYPAHAVLVVLAGVLVSEKVDRFVPKDWAIGAILAAIVAVAQFIVLRDPVLSLYGMKMKGMADPQFWGFYLISGAALVILLKLTRKDLPLTPALTVALAIGLVGANLGLDWKQRAPIVTSISWNNYGEEGFAEAAAHLNSVLKPGDVPICRKDFGFYLLPVSDPVYRQWINPAVLTEARTGQELVENITAPGISHIVLDRYSIRREALPIIQHFYDLDRQIGSYYILRRNSKMP